MSRIVLGVSGGIAAYKACDLIRLLTKRGGAVQVVMTQAAQKFITPLTLSILSQRPVCTELFEYSENAQPKHIELAKWAEGIILYPLSANLMAEIASGLAYNLILSVIMASKCPIYAFHSMNDVMWENEQVQRNIKELKKQSRIHLYDPIEGDLACQSFGIGHTIEPNEVIKKLEKSGMLN